MSSASSYTANVFMPGCLGPVKRDVYLAEDYDALRAELDAANIAYRIRGDVITEKNAELAALRAENGQLRDVLKTMAAKEFQDALEKQREADRAELAALKAVPDGVETFSPGFTAPQSGHPSDVEAYMFEDDAGEWMTVAQHNARIAEKDAQIEGLRQKLNLCEDEGCPHSGTDHVCLSGRPVADERSDIEGDN